MDIHLESWTSNVKSQWYMWKRLIELIPDFVQWYFAPSSHRFRILNHDKRSAHEEFSNVFVIHKFYNRLFFEKMRKIRRWIRKRATTMVNGISNHNKSFLMDFMPMQCNKRLRHPHAFPLKFYCLFYNSCFLDCHFAISIGRSQFACLI